MAYHMLDAFLHLQSSIRSQETEIGIAHTWLTPTAVMKVLNSVLPDIGITPKIIRSFFTLLNGNIVTQPSMIFVFKTFNADFKLGLPALFEQ